MFRICWENKLFFNLRGPFLARNLIQSKRLRLVRGWSLPQFHTREFERTWCVFRRTVTATTRCSTFKSTLPRNLKIESWAWKVSAMTLRDQSGLAGDLKPSTASAREALHPHTVGRCSQITNLSSFIESKHCRRSWMKIVRETLWAIATLSSPARTEVTCDRK